MNQLETLIKQSNADALYIRQLEDANTPEILALRQEREELLKEVSTLKDQNQWLEKYEHRIAQLMAERDLLANRIKVMKADAEQYRRLSS